MTISKNDFRFAQTGYGHYDVYYTSPKTGKVYGCNTTDMTIIDETKNEDNPKIKNLNTLKAMCKRASKIVTSHK